MKETTKERERIYAFFLQNLNMKAEEIAETFEVSISTLRRVKSGKLEACYRITKRIIELEIQEDETIFENNGDGVNHIHDVHA